MFFQRFLPVLAFFALPLLSRPLEHSESQDIVSRSPHMNLEGFKPIPIDTSGLTAAQKAAIQAWEARVQAAGIPFAKFFTFTGGASTGTSLGAATDSASDSDSDSSDDDTTATSTGNDENTSGNAGNTGNARIAGNTGNPGNTQTCAQGANSGSATGDQTSCQADADGVTSTSSSTSR